MFSLGAEQRSVLDVKGKHGGGPNFGGLGGGSSRLFLCFFGLLMIDSGTILSGGGGGEETGTGISVHKKLRHYYRMFA